MGYAGFGTLLREFGFCRSLACRSYAIDVFALVVVDPFTTSTVHCSLSTRPSHAEGWILVGLRRRFLSTLLSER